MLSASPADVQRTREENSAQVLLLSLGLPSASLFSFSVSWFEILFIQHLNSFRKELLIRGCYYLFISGESLVKHLVSAFQQ